MKLIFKFIYICLALLMSWIELFATSNTGNENVVIIDKDFVSKRYITEFGVFRDLDNKYTFRDVVGVSFQKFFEPVTSSSPSFGYSNITLWVKITIENATSEVKKLVVCCENKNISEILLFDNSQIGDFKTVKHGKIVTDSLVDYFENKDFEFTMQPRRTASFYFKITNYGTNLSLPFSIYEKNEYNRWSKIYLFHTGVFYGFLMLVFVISMIFYISQRRKIAFWYSIFVIGCAIFYLHEDGLLNRLLITRFSWWSDDYSYILILMPVITMFFVIRQITYKSKYAKQMNLLIYCSAGAMLCLPLIFSFFSVNPHNLAALFCGISLITICILCGIIRTIENNAFNNGLFIAVIILLLNVFIYYIGSRGFITLGFAIDLIRLGFFIHVVILAYGLASLFHLSIHRIASSEVEELEKLNRIKDEINCKLEEKVRQRTEELAKLNQELTDANKQIKVERDVFETQNNLFAQQKKEITDSIMYAQRIQKSFVSAKDNLHAIFNDYFILEQPRDIVGGDFYWISEIENKVLIAVADCTGHGVPGAFMSIIGSLYLNEIVYYHKITNPSTILGMLRDKVVDTFSNSNGETIAKDGMDISLVAIDKSNKHLEFAGAYNPLLIVRENQLITIRSDKMPISVSDKQSIPFTNNEFELIEGDSIYMFTDGFVDQFGWRTGKKFNVNQLKELLLDVNELPLEARRVIIYNSFKNWKGDLEQTDDVLLFGLRV